MQLRTLIHLGNKTGTKTRLRNKQLIKRISFWKKWEAKFWRELECISLDKPNICELHVGPRKNDVVWYYIFEPAWIRREETQEDLENTAVEYSEA